MTPRNSYADLPPAQRKLAASEGSLHRWSRVTSPEARREAVAPAQRGRRAKWAREIDPDGQLAREAPAELEQAIDRRRRAHMKALARASVAARAAKKKTSPEARAPRIASRDDAA